MVETRIPTQEFSGFLVVTIEHGVQSVKYLEKYDICPQKTPRENSN
jgi:hypothetical protein